MLVHLEALLKDEFYSFIRRTPRSHKSLNMYNHTLNNKLDDIG